MTKILAYYSLIITTLTVLSCLFSNNKDFEMLIGGIIFIPVAYSLWEMTTELRTIETTDKQYIQNTRLREEIRKDEELLRQKIKEEIEDNEKI